MNVAVKYTIGIVCAIIVSGLLGLLVWTVSSHFVGKNDKNDKNDKDACKNKTCSAQLMSANKCKVQMQQDGNLVVYNPNRYAVWSSGTMGKGVGPYSLVMLADGDLMVIDSTDTVTWKSDSKGQGSGPYTAKIKDDCNFVVVDSTNTTIWHSNTSGTVDKT